MTINKKIEKKSFKLHFFLVTIVFLLTILQIVFANRLIAAGKTLQSLEQQVELLESENRKLTTEIATQGSLERLKKESANLGFIKDPPVFNLSSDKPIALKF